MSEECREKVLSEDYRDFIIPDYQKEMEIVYPTSEACVQEAGFDYRVVYISAQQTQEITIENYGYNSIPGVFGLIDMDAMNEAGISAVQNYPTLQLQGKNIMIGFVDTGIDYQNPVFRDMGGSTRIAGIWDQTIQTGQVPEGFSYGSEYTEAVINEALRSETPLKIVPSVDTNGHGTFVASVAAGGANEEARFQGAAPRAVIAVVKLKEAKTYLKEFYAVKEGAVCYQENDIMLGIYYLHRLAVKRRLPLVLCVALGSNFGGHNSASLLSRMLRDYANTSDRCVVIGGGNEANQRHHYYGTVERVGVAKEVEIRVEESGTGFVAELWTTLPNILTAYLVSPTGERTPTISIRQGSRYTLTFPFDRTTVEVEYRLLMDNNDSQLLFFRFTKAAAGLWRIGVEPLRIAGGAFHLWISMQEFLSGKVYFLEANPDYTLTEPAGAEDAITVSYYNGVNNSVDINSGRGYTRNRLIKPDFAAPGVQVTGAGTDGRFVKRSGSSIAAGIAAGGAALIMEWLWQQPNLIGITTSQVKNIMILGTNQEVLPEYPNREWGYGTMDIYQSLDRLRSL